MMDDKTFQTIGVSLVDAVLAAKFVETRSQARRLIEGGAIRVDGIQILDSRARLIMLNGRGVVLLKEATQNG